MASETGKPVRKRTKKLPELNSEQMELLIGLRRLWEQNPKESFGRAVIKPISRWLYMTSSSDARYREVIAQLLEGTPNG